MSISFLSNIRCISVCGYEWSFDNLGRVTSTVIQFFCVLFFLVPVCWWALRILWNFASADATEVLEDGWNKLCVHSLCAQSHCCSIFLNLLAIFNPLITLCLSSLFPRPATANIPFPDQFKEIHFPFPLDPGFAPNTSRHLSRTGVHTRRVERNLALTFFPPQHL